MDRIATGPIFGGEELAVNAAAGFPAVDVDKTLAAEIAVDFLAFRRQDDANVRDLAPTGGQDKAGSHAESGVNLPEDFKAGFCAGGRVIGADNFILVNLGGVNAGRSHLNGGGLRPLAGKGKGNDQPAVIIEGKDIVIIHREGNVLAAFRCPRNFDFYGVPEDTQNGDRGLQILNGDGGFLVRLLVLFGVKHIHEDNGGDVGQFEVCVDALTKGVTAVVLVPIIRIAELLHGLRVGIGNNRGVGGGVGVRGQVDRGGPENDLQPCRPLQGRDDACGLFKHSYAMFVSHCVVTPSLLLGGVPLGLLIEGVNPALLLPDLVQGHGKASDGDAKAQEVGGFFRGLPQLLGDFAVGGVAGGQADDRRANVDHPGVGRRGRSLGGLFGLFCFSCHT